MISVAVNPVFTGKIGHDHPKRWSYNNTFENMELANLRELAVWVWRGHPYCATHKHEHIPYISKRTGEEKRTSYRHGLNFTGTNVLSLDFDEGTYKSSFQGLMEDSIVREYGGVLYSTQSSTPTAPRTRLIFELEQVITDPEAYRIYTEALMHRFQTKDRSCSDVCRIFAGSKNCQVQIIGKVLTMKALTGIVELYKNYVRQRVEDRRSAIEKQIEDENVNEDRIRDALNAMPLFKSSSGWNMEYSDWRRVIAAIHSWDPTQLGYQVAVDWTGHEYADEIESMFESYDRHMGLSANIATLFFLAKERGWRDTMKFDSHEQMTAYTMTKGFRQYA